MEPHVCYIKGITLLPLPHQMKVYTEGLMGRCTCMLGRADYTLRPEHYYLRTGGCYLRTENHYSRTDDCYLRIKDYYLTSDPEEDRPSVVA